MNAFNENYQVQAMTDKPAYDVLRNYLHDVRQYVKFANKVTELIRLTDDVADIPLDDETSVADLMMWLIQRGEKLNTQTEQIYDFIHHLRED